MVIVIISLLDWTSKIPYPKPAFYIQKTILSAHKRYWCVGAEQFSSYNFIIVTNIGSKLHPDHHAPFSWLPVFNQDPRMSVLPVVVQ